MSLLHSLYGARVSVKMTVISVKSVSKPRSLFRDQDRLDLLCDILLRTSRKRYIGFSIIIEADDFRVKYSQKAVAKRKGNKPRKIICLISDPDVEEEEEFDDHDDLEEVDTPGTPPNPNPNPNGTPPPPLTPPPPPPPPLTTPETPQPPVGRDTPTPPQQLELGEIAAVATRALVITYTPVDIVKFCSLASEVKEMIQVKPLCFLKGSQRIEILNLS